MKKLTIYLIPLLTILSCSENCPEGINKLPLYGNVEKCKKQINIDNDFIAECDKEFKSRKEASEHYTKKGWAYFFRNNLDSAIMRFNQAWLLDSLNADVYWGFGNILGKQADYKGSLEYFQKSVEINPNNPKVWESYATSYGQLFVQKKDIEDLDNTIMCLKNTIKFEPNNGRAMGQITNAYSYYAQKDSAKLYMQRTDYINPAFVHADVRAMLSE